MKKELWLDIRNLKRDEIEKLALYSIDIGYNGILLSVSQIEFWKSLNKNVKYLMCFLTEEDIEKFLSDYEDIDSIYIFTNDESVLNDDRFIKLNKGIYSKVKDKESMDKAIHLSKSVDTVILEFDSETNIPLELIIAYSQKYKTKICKKVQQSEAGWIATMTMEVGCEAILLETTSIDDIVELKNRVENELSDAIEIDLIEVEEIKHIGMGDRVCIDTTSELSCEEGMMIGSTSSGGVLVSSETHYLPYMDLRPFRVNAGALHSYIFCSDNKTKYLSELKAGDDVMVVDVNGKTRTVSVGRIKIERRPMLLVRGVSRKTGSSINVIVQDDWHIRIFGENGKVINSTEIKKGTLLLGISATPGRHMGVDISEKIIER